MPPCHRPLRPGASPFKRGILGRGGFGEDGVIDYHRATDGERS